MTSKYYEFGGKPLRECFGCLEIFLFSDDIALDASVNLKCYSVIVHWESDLPLSSISDSSGLC